ncbi:acetoacetate decarboxylase [Fusarium oxysporum f. sp. raphani 54005]|uniref:Acetoacetate decarboxylase n=2 Tax=Fusarium oxysporum f. sp. raphani TaxID=96318 RepID=X0BD06_FUSOX|nr:acetoacetate decarboxylase [Fusarium oxysporum f. sp. raphani 54005]KAG7432563.1 putative acetoacetate decarboxylase [Fusarium oxysporum f. sp. raphani]KAJ4045858.1 hypothetical protein NW758_006050 [Fusarium oxysporum]WKT46872.1 Acetoacetate decarboxylase domain superfamily [Fusarium oxysporum f. sp. vasinfectum]KAJ4087903.1 hypothetical protein NW761_007874 [Fusarium oxysporum]
MSFVATPEEVQAFEDLSSNPSFSQELIVTDFETTPEFIQSVLPPNFEAGDTPTGHISVGTFESKLCGEFDCAMVSIDVKFNGRPGTYLLELIVSGDMPVTWGREVWGEVKKTGTCKIWRSGNYRYAVAERYGVRLIELQGEFGDDQPPRIRENTAYEIKAYPHSMGRGLQWAPKVNQLKVVEHDTRWSKGTGRITIRGTSSDPLHSIPIKAISEFIYCSGRSDYNVVADYDLGATDAYLPYLVGRHYDDLRRFKVGIQWTQMKDEEEDEKPTLVQRLQTPQ